MLEGGTVPWRRRSSQIPSSIYPRAWRLSCVKDRAGERAEGRGEGAKGAAAHIAFRWEVAATASEFTRARTPP